MLGTEPDGMTLSIMCSIYARKAKEIAQGSSQRAQLFMYAFFDAMERTAVAFNNVLDGKKTAREGYDWLIDYAIRLNQQLEELEDEDDE